MFASIYAYVPHLETAFLFLHFCIYRQAPPFPPARASPRAAAERNPIQYVHNRCTFVFCRLADTPASVRSVGRRSARQHYFNERISVARDFASQSAFRASRSGRRRGASAALDRDHRSIKDSPWAIYSLAHDQAPGRSAQITAPQFSKRLSNYFWSSFLVGPSAVPAIYFRSHSILAPPR